MPAGLSTFWSFPPQPPLWRVFGFSSNDCQISVSSPHLAQRYRYVGIGPALSSGVGASAVFSTHQGRVLMLPDLGPGEAQEAPHGSQWVPW